MKKRGSGLSKQAQVSVFIIVAIVLISGIAFMFFAFKGNDRLIPRSPFENPDVSNAKDALTDCMKTKTYEGLKRIGLQGGYFNKPSYYYQLDWAILPYYYYDGTILFPGKEKIQTELGAYVDNNLKDCLDNIKLNNIKLNYADSRTTTKIEKSKVTFTIDLPVTITREDKAEVIQLKNYPVVFNSSLNEMIEVADYITNSHADSPNLMCVNCIISMAEERKLYVDFIKFPFSDYTTLVMLSENKTGPEPYEFEFLNKYQEVD